MASDYDFVDVRFFTEPDDLTTRMANADLGVVALGDIKQGSKDSLRPQVVVVPRCVSGVVDIYERDVPVGERSDGLFECVCRESRLSVSTRLVAW